VPVTRLDHVKAAAAGLVILFTPMSIARMITGVQVGGGRGLLAIVDLETLFIDATLAAVLVLVWRRRQQIGTRWPVVVFALILSATTALLLGYVVTNFGTLWRLRPLAVIPLWLVGLAVGGHRAVIDRSASPLPEVRVHERG